MTASSKMVICERLNDRRRSCEAGDCFRQDNGLRPGDRKGDISVVSALAPSSARTVDGHQTCMGSAQAPRRFASASDSANLRADLAVGCAVGAQSCVAGAARRRRRSAVLPESVSLRDRVRDEPVGGKCSRDGWYDPWGHGPATRARWTTSPAFCTIRARKSGYVSADPSSRTRVRRLEARRVCGAGPMSDEASA
jgi:hypothetical protein